MQFDIKKWMPHIISILVIIGFNLIYFLPQIQGKVIRQNDIVQYNKMAKSSNDYLEKTGKFALWNPSMFGGMPNYQTAVGNPGNKLSYIDSILTLGLKWPLGLFIYGMILFYISMVLLGVNRWLALIGSFMFAFNTVNVILFEAGHNSKLMTLMTAAPIIAGVLLAYQKQYLKGGVLFGLSMGLNILHNHPQMTYYLGLTMIPLVLIYLIDALMKKDMINFIKSSIVLLLGLGLAIGASASKLWTTYEYQEDTMRGKPILEAAPSAAAAESVNTDGLEYEYAMQWSNGWDDLVASYIPYAVGGGSGEFVSKDTPIGRKLRASKEVQAPTYHGSLPFTSGPLYLGAIALFLCFLGALIIPGRMKWWLVSAIVMTLLLSMGKHFSGFNDLFFNHVPLFNKFRTPNSILSITAIFVPILAILAVNRIIEEKDKSTLIKPLYISLGIMGGIALLFAIMGGAFINMDGESDGNYAQILDALIETRESMLSSSAWKTFLFVLASGGLIWMYLKDKIKSGLLIGLLSLFALIDQGGMAVKYLGHNDFVNKRTQAADFNPREVDQQILSDKELGYRVYDGSINTFNSADASYFHNTIGGYHPAKLQRIQDIIERHISKGNQSVMNMLNTKYYITQAGEGQTIVQQNPNASGAVWFVREIVMVQNANAEIDSLTQFEPKQKAFVNQEFESYIESNKAFSGEGTIKLVNSDMDEMTYESDASTNQFAVFSEVWYGPNKGWQAYIDGQPVDHIRVNYLLRGMKVPAGKHTIKFEFKPKSYYTGERISLISSLLLLVLGLLGVVLKLRKGSKQEEA